MQKICLVFTRLIPVWIVVFGGAAYGMPGLFLPLKPHLDLLFFFTMIGIGAVLQIDDFLPIVKNPLPVMLGILVQFTIMPVLGYLIGHLLGLPPALKVGLVIAGCVPGAMASNVIAYLARTDVAYSIALTTTATLLAPVLTPLLTYAYARTTVTVPVFGMLISILTTVVLPLGIGMVLRRVREEQVGRLSFLFPAVSTLCIALICALVVAVNRERFPALSLIAFTAVALHNAGGLAGGYGAAQIFRFDSRRSRTLAIEVGMQNAGLGALLALEHFGDETALVPAVFATWCVITASLLAEVWLLRQERRQV